MKKALLLLTAFALSATACNDDDNNNSTGLEGNWKLVGETNGFSGTAYTFEPGTIIWNFDVSETQINVTDNTAVGSHSPLSTGSYQYELAQNDFCDNGLSILLDDYYADFGCHNIANDTLTISAGHVDGDTFTFIR